MWKRHPQWQHQLSWKSHDGDIYPESAGGDAPHDDGEIVYGDESAMTTGKSTEMRQMRTYAGMSPYADSLEHYHLWNDVNHGE